ncbi:MAG TPA: CRISPR-associated protein Csn1, partial [Ignavibacteria bacterium]|nr:CRISPR-associated protein Csn1 [Ignavibacteria bacterium]
EIKPYSPSQQEILKVYEEGVYQNLGVDYNEVNEDEIEKIRKSSSPTKTEILRYKLWLNQGYISPYTGKVITLSKLFTTDYQIEHIIPQSRYFDDSLSNKVICESEVNQLKDNQTAYEFIKNHGGEKADLGQGKSVEIFKLEDYENHCNKYFKKSRTKLRNLLSEDVPDGFINRQLNDSRYISKLIKGLLSNIIRQEGEQEAIAKNIVTLTGSITSILKQNWGLNDKWNELIAPRFKRLNELTGSEDFGSWDTKINAFRIKVPDEISKGFSKKRIDHRHHALDALVIACCTKDHVNYITSLNTNRNNYNLVTKLREIEEVEIYNKNTNERKKRSVAKTYKMPWPAFPEDAKNALEKAIVSFKQNLRVINKTNNKTWQWIEKQGKYKKQLVPQVKGDNWAIRKPLHTPLPYGKREYNFSTLEISKSISKWKSIIDKDIRDKVEKLLIQNGYKIGRTSMILKQNPILNKDGKKIRFTAYSIKENRFRKRQPIFKLANRGNSGIKTSEQAIKFINKIADRVIRKDLLEHLKENQYDIDKAFSIEGIEKFNSKRIIPVNKVPVSEVSTRKFPLGKNYDTRKKYGEAESGTNLFFAIYQDDKGKRSYETVPLNEVIEHQKQTAHLPKEERTVIPIKPEKGQFLFSLSPNDLVYVPTKEEKDNPAIVDFKHLTKEQVSRIYKMVSCTGNRLYCLQNNIAKPIFNKFEFSSLNKLEFDLNNLLIKKYCWKLKTDRLGNIIQVIK